MSRDHICDIEPYIDDYTNLMVCARVRLDNTDARWTCANGTHIQFAESGRWPFRLTDDAGKLHTPSYTHIVTHPKVFQWFHGLSQLELGAPRVQLKDSSWHKQKLGQLSRELRIRRTLRNRLEASRATDESESDERLPTRKRKRPTVETDEFAQEVLSRLEKLEEKVDRSGRATGDLEKQFSGALTRLEGKMSEGFEKSLKSFKRKIDSSQDELCEDLKKNVEKLRETMQSVIEEARRGDRAFTVRFEPAP